MKVNCVVAAATFAACLQATPFWGAEASGNGRQFEITCSTCPNPVTEFPALSDGGLGSRLASIDFSAAGNVSYHAIAIFTGGLALPHLGVNVSAGIQVVPPSTFFFAAGATARSTQEFLYTGTRASDYTLEYAVNGSVSGGILAELAGGFTVFGSGFRPNQEIEPVLGFSFDHVNGDGGETPVHFTGDVTFHLNPGDRFFVQATLDAFVDSRSEQLPATVDASHTLEMAFTQGDTSLLVPAAPATQSSVPEPGAALLTGAGLLSLAAVARRRLLR